MYPAFGKQNLSRILSRTDRFSVMASSILQSFTNLALTEFIEVYGDIMTEKQVTTAMSGEELRCRMQKKIFGLSSTPAKKPSFEEVETESAQACLETIAEEPVIANKLTLKELKSNPLEYPKNEKIKMESKNQLPRQSICRGCPIASTTVVVVRDSR
jgi:hypothetical protein